MHRMRVVVGCAVVAAQLAIALPAGAGTGVLGSTGASAPAAIGASAAKSDPATMALPRPSWYTEKLHRRVLAAGHRGVDVQLSRKQAKKEPVLDCLGYSPPAANPPSHTAVSAGGCMVYPHGCSMNFIFTDGASKYIGTAGHCLTGGGGQVVMQVATRVDPTDSVVVTLAAIGKATKKMNGGIGADFGIVKINPGWAVQPAVAGAAGPTGVFCGDPVGQPVVHYGHGYVFFVEQGHPKVGEVIPDLSMTGLIRFKSEQYGFNWIGYGVPGDSGSPVMNAAGLAVGDLTHGIGIGGIPIPGISFGTTMGGIFDFLGRGYKLVTADGVRTVDCANPVGA